MATYKAYECILENSTEKEAIEWARGYCFEGEAKETEIGYANYVDTVNGVKVYYDYAADYYFFVEAEENE